jgi:hypothetical protein
MLPPPPYRISVSILDGLVYAPHSWQSMEEAHSLKPDAPNAS